MDESEARQTAASRFVLRERAVPARDPRHDRDKLRVGRTVEGKFQALIDAQPAGGAGDGARPGGE